MTPRETRAKMLAHSWAHGLYPEHGDVKAMTMGLEDASQVTTARASGSSVSVPSRSSWPRC